MATENAGTFTGLFGGVLDSGRAGRPRAEYPADAAGHGAMPGTDGKFLGNIHMGRGVDPDAHADAVTADGGAAPVNGSGADGAGPIEIPADGLPIALPLLPDFPGVSIAVDVTGLPENTVLSSGHAVSPGHWQLDMADAAGLRLRAAGTGDNTLPGPPSLGVSYVVTNDATGEARIVQLGQVSAVADADAAANTLSESAADGDSVGIRAAASDPDSYDRIIYTLLDDAGGRFAIDPLSGEVTVKDASLLDYETATSHTIVVQAESTDGSKTTATFTIELTDDNTEFSVTPVTDTDAAADGASESVSNGDVVGVTAFASDGDATDSVTYSLADDAGGRFAIDATTGVVTVADAALLDYETATSHTITVQATSTDGTTETRTFTIALSDDTSEFAVTPVSDSDAAANTVSESASNGDTVGVTAFASDGDTTDSVTYSLVDDAGGRFAIDAATGQVTVADASLLDYETATSHTITVQATSTDGSTKTQSFTVALSDDTSEFSITAVSDADAATNRVSESAADGAVVGVTAFASDADGTDTVTYSLTNDAGGRFAVDAATGVVTVADASLLDYESATSHKITVQATSTDGSTRTQNFTIKLADDRTEFSVTPVSDADAAADTVSESASNGDTVGITAFADDADRSDKVTYKLTDDAGGRFAIDSKTGVVTVKNAALLDYETATSHDITVQAKSSDGSIQTQTFTIALADDTGEYSVTPVADSNSAADGVSESATNGATVGITAFASDADGTDTVTYSLTDDAGGRFAIDATTGVVTVADASLLDYETAPSHTITVQAASSDGSTQTQSYTIGLTDDTSEFSITAVTDTNVASDAVSESASNGDVVGVTAFASDADATDTVTYSLSDDAGGRFAIDATTGVVTVADASLLDYETATSHTITVQATSSDGSTQTQSFTIGLSDDTSEFTVSAVSDTNASANSVSESASNGDVVGVTAFASDADATDTVTYSLTDDAGGRFAIDATTGVVTVADASLLDYETATSHTITVQATSSDGSTQTQSFTIGLSDDTSEFTVSAVSDSDASANSVSESASNGDVVGVTAFASDADATDTVTYSLTDNAGGRFAIDAATGVVTVADASLLDYETATSHTITVQAESSDGSTVTKSFTVALSDDTGEFSISAVSDTNAASDSVSEGASNGDVVGVTAFASDADGSDTVTYSLTDNADGRFAIDATTGVVTVADASLLDYETATSHSITVQATSSDGSTRTQSFAVGLSDDTSEFSVSALSDTDASANSVSENASNGDTVGITGFASDADATDTVTYSLSDNAGGRFAIDATTGQVTVADASLLDYETAASHTITVQAASSDGSTQSRQFTIAVEDGNSAPTDLTFTNGDTYGNAVEGQDPVAHWRLGDAAGSAVATDAMGNHHGSYNQGANGGNASGPFADISSTAASFDGANDYVEVPTSPDFVLAQGTIQAWFKVDSFGGRDHTILSMDSSGTDTGGVYLAVDGTRKDVEFFIDDSVAPVTFGETGNHYMLSGDNTVTAGQWHHVAVTFGPAGMVMYLDGVQVATNAYTGGIGNGDNEPITIGASQRNAGTEGQALPGELDRFFDGQIAEVALYDTALSGATLTAIADAGINGHDIPADAVVENAADGTVVGLVEAIDPDSGESFTYTLLDDAGGRFAIDSSTGVVTVANGALLDYETATQHTLTVQVTDSGGASYSESFTVNLADASELSGPGFVVGTDGDDRITGTSNAENHGGEEILLGQAGDDVLFGYGNEDRLVGGDGDDTLSGGDQSDILIGGAGDDTADGGSGNDVFAFRMGDGHDTVSGGTGTDTILLMGTDGGTPDPSDWSLNLTSGSASWSMDHVSLSSGSAGTITFSDGSSVTFDGVETIDFSGDASLDNTGRVTIADAGGDTITGGNDEDTILGGAGADHLSGGNNEDLLMGGGGADALYGGNDDDMLVGEGGADALYGDKGDDVLVGGDDDDALYGGQGDDVLYGDAGNDALYGEDGNDILHGGQGDDAAYGGKGDDIYVFGAGGGSDSFAGGGGAWTDTIQLSGVDGVTAYNGWTVAGATVVGSGDGYVELAADSDGTITMDDGSQLAFTDVDRIEW